LSTPPEASPSISPTPFNNSSNIFQRLITQNNLSFNHLPNSNESLQTLSIDELLRTN